jgi:hypothetical protein
MIFYLDEFVFKTGFFCRICFFAKVFLRYLFFLKHVSEIVCFLKGDFFAGFFCGCFFVGFFFVVSFFFAVFDFLDWKRACWVFFGFFVVPFFCGDVVFYRVFFLPLGGAMLTIPVGIFLVYIIMYIYIYVYT